VDGDNNGNQVTDSQAAGGSGRNQVTDSVQNTTVRLIPREQPAEDGEPETEAPATEGTTEQQPEEPAALSCTLPGAQDVALSDVLSELEIA
jgi:hypothetical protein